MGRRWNNFLIAWHIKDPEPVLPAPPSEIAATSWVDAQRDLLAAKLRAEEAAARVDMLEKRVTRLAYDKVALGDAQ